MRQGLGRSATIAATSAAVTVFVAFGPGAAISRAWGAASSEQHCQSFAYQQDAQEEWEKWGPSDPWRWDPDGNGKVCESMPSRPPSAARAARPSAAAASSAADETDGGVDGGTEHGTTNGTVSAAGSTHPGAASAPESTWSTRPSGSSAPSEDPWSGEPSWGGHHWDDGQSAGGHSWEDSPRPVGGVQAGGGGQADDGHGGTPVLPLAGVAVGALLLIAGAKSQRHRST